jgi:hypothetical protein
MKNTIVIAVIAAVISGGAGFWGGMQYQKSSQTAMGPGTGQMAGGNGQDRPSGFPGGDSASGAGAQAGGMQQGGMMPTSGEIVSVDDQTFTVETQDGDSKIVILSGSTTINTTSEGSVDDLAVGETVMVIGEADDDGTVTATTVSVGGEFRGGPGTGAALEE